MFCFFYLAYFKSQLKPCVSEESLGNRSWPGEVILMILKIWPLSISFFHRRTFYLRHC